jgi:hypothetical protein
MEYKFYLDSLEIEEPIGWADLELSMRRDDKTHGIQFEVSTGTLKFYGLASNYLIQQKQLYGIKTNVLFTAQEFCASPYEPVEEITGRLNFGKFKKVCGEQCIVEIPLEEDSCKVVFKNKYDQKVDIDKTTTFNGVTALANYTQLGVELTLKAKALQASIDGAVGDDTADVIELDAGGGGSLNWFRPTYYLERYNNIETGQLQPVNNYECNAGCINIGNISPQLLFDDVIDCFDGNWEYSIRKKGNLTTTGGGGIFHIKMKLVKWDAVGDIFTDGEVLDELELFNGLPTPPSNVDIDFDGTLTGILTGGDAPQIDDGIYAILEIGNGGTAHMTVTFDSETSFTLSAKRLCPDTQVKSYLVHETLSRVAEAITDNCVRVKSEYYGRTDSQPFAFDSDGCGGLRMLTSGLKIRRAPEDRFFASMKDLFEGLNPIDNIGFDIVEDPDNPGKFLMRIEDVDFFYKDEEIFIIDAIPVGTSEVQENMHYGRVLVGYKKWEVEGVNGLDEFNSTREYRTSLDTVSNILDITSALVTGSYPIEHTRLQNFADSGAADTKFDNDIFLITLKRLAYDFEVEQDNVSDAANFFDPDTIYNFRLSPLRNLMRWYKTIVAGYANINSNDNKLFFSAGTGNLIATGEIIEGAYDQLCKLEAMPIMESQNLFTTHFARTADYTPLWQNETFAHEYPLNIAEYKSIKQNPYGYISYQCGTGEYEKAFIKEIKFKPAKGRATFLLIKKWE